MIKPIKDHLGAFNNRLKVWIRSLHRETQENNEIDGAKSGGASEHSWFCQQRWFNWINHEGNLLFSYQKQDW
jgi:hypothetical protein